MENDNFFIELYDSIDTGYIFQGIKNREIAV